MQSLCTDQLLPEPKHCKMSFYDTSLNVRLDDDNKTLRADCADVDGHYHPSSINISQYLGNHNGCFVQVPHELSSLRSSLTIPSA